MFAVLIGLSMDYEVLLLSRIQEAYRRTGDNAAAVAEGLSETAGVITGAALIMVTVFAAFALADTVTIKSIGVGMALAVALDATIVRVLLVPATMRLLGRWNWWAPGPLGRLAERVRIQPRRGRGGSRRRRAAATGRAVGAGRRAGLTVARKRRRRDDGHLGSRARPTTEHDQSQRRRRRRARSGATAGSGAARRIAGRSSRGSACSWSSTARCC